MDDLISRAAAIKRATKDHDFYKGATIPTDKARRDELLNVMCWLGELPSAQPERKRGRWIRQDNKGKPFYGWYQCSECGAVIGGKTNFCSECGADMREVDDERPD